MYRIINTLISVSKPTLSSRRGSALVLSILLTMMLFLVGMGFISMMITDKASITRIDDKDIIDNAVDEVIEQINTAALMDLGAARYFRRPAA